MKHHAKVLSSTFLAAVMLLALLVSPATAAPQRVEDVRLTPKLAGQINDALATQRAPGLDLDRNVAQLPPIESLPSFPPTTPVSATGPTLVWLDLSYMWQSSVDAPGRGTIGGWCEDPYRIDRQAFITLSEGGQSDWNRATWKGRVAVDEVFSRAELALPAGRTSAFGVLEAIDNDSVGCGGFDDRLDINPDAGDTNLDLPIRVDLVANEVWQTSGFPYGEDVRLLGDVGTEITSRGNDESTDRGGVKFKVRLSPLAKAPTEIRLDQIRPRSSDDLQDMPIGIWTRDGAAAVAYADDAPFAKASQPVEDWEGMRTAASEARANPGWTNARRTPASRIVSGTVAAGGTSIRIQADMRTGVVDQVINHRDHARRTFHRLGIVGTPIKYEDPRGEGPGITFTVLGPVTEPVVPATARTSTFTVERVEWLRGSDPGDADFKGEIRMSTPGNAGRLLETAHVQDDNDITPGWNQSIRTRTNVPFNVAMTLKEDNTFSDDIYDIAIRDGRKDLALVVTGDRIVVDGSYVGDVGESITTTGGRLENYRARVTFRIDHSNAAALPAPPVSTMVEIRSLKRTGGAEMWASGPSADHKATITLATQGSLFNRRSVFASSPAENAIEAFPGWSTSILAAPSTSIRAIIQIEDDNVAAATQVDVTPTTGKQLDVTIAPDGRILGPDGEIGRVGTPFTTTGTSLANAAMTVLIRQR